MYLLDTNTVLIALSHPNALPVSIRDAVLEGRNSISVLSYWEVLLKSMKGKLDVGEPNLWWQEALGQLTARPLPFRPDHVAAVRHLPPIHQDPFDRALIGQAIAENLTLVTLDGEIPKYASDRFRVLV